MYVARRSAGQIAFETEDCPGAKGSFKGKWFALSLGREGIVFLCLSSLSFSLSLFSSFLFLSFHRYPLFSFFPALLRLSALLLFLSFSLSPLFFDVTFLIRYILFLTFATSHFQVFGLHASAPYIQLPTKLRSWQLYSRNHLSPKRI